MIPILEVDMARRNFLRNSLKAAVGTALVAGQKQGKKPPTIGMPKPTEQAKKVMRAGEHVATTKHVHDMAKTGGKVMNAPGIKKVVDKSQGLSQIRGRLGKLEKGLDKPISALDKMGADTPMTRKQFLDKAVSVLGAGTRKYMKYKTAPIRKIAGMFGPGTGGALKYLDPTVKKSAALKFAGMFASKRIDQIELKRLDLLGEYI
jgi:hypothetical protein